MDDQAWTETRQRLRAFVGARLAPASTVDDVVQEVLAKMVEHLDDLTNHTKVEAWAYRIARNAITDEYRRRGRYDAALTRLAEAPTPLQTPVDDAVLSADLIELADCLRPLADALDPLYRDALLLTSWDGLTQAQAAERVGITVPGMKSRVQRARAQLRRQLTACCDVESTNDGPRGRPTSPRRVSTAPTNTMTANTGAGAGASGCRCASTSQPAGTSH